MYEECEYPQDEIDEEEEFESEKYVDEDLDYDEYEGFDPQEYDNDPAD